MSFDDQKTQNEKYIIEEATSGNLKTLEKAITDFNILVAPELPKAIIQRLDFTITNPDGSLMGGIQAMMVNWGIVQIDLLFIFQEYRTKGLGSRLLQHVENIARKNGCHLSHLDTFDFQGKDFYLKQGYEIFGILDNSPKGHQRYYLSKKLTR